MKKTLSRFLVTAMIAASALSSTAFACEGVDHDSSNLFVNGSNVAVQLAWPVICHWSSICYGEHPYSTKGQVPYEKTFGDKLCYRLGITENQDMYGQTWYTGHYAKY